MRGIVTDSHCGTEYHFVAEHEGRYRHSHCCWRFFALTCVLLSSGCVGRFERPKTPAVIAVPPPDGKTGNYTLDDYSKDLKAYADATDAAVVRLRNKMVYSLMAEIDFAFGDYETRSLTA